MPRRPVTFAATASLLSRRRPTPAGTASLLSRRRTTPAGTASPVPRRILALAALPLTLLLTACPDEQAAPPAARFATAYPAFEGERAFAHIERQVAFGPRVPGSEGHARQLEWMTEHLRELADTVEVQRFTHTARAGGTIEMANVIARLRPGLADRVLLAAHWDTRPMADQEADEELRSRPIPGANDGGSGVAVLMELAELLAENPPPVGVDLVFFDGEDFGPGEMFLGATHFAANLPPGYRPMYAIVVDMVADAHDPRFPIEQNSQRYADAVVSRVWSLAADIGFGDYFPRQVGPAIDDDHIPLNRAGIPAIVIIDFEYGPGNRYWHTLQDDVHNVGPQGLHAVGNVLSALISLGG